MATISGVGAMRLVAQPTGIDIAVHDLRCYRFGFSGGERLSRRRWFATVASGATSRARVTSAPLLDELMARKAGNLGHAMLVHGHLFVASTAREAIDWGSVLLQYVALVTSQVRQRGDVILVTNRPRRLRIPFLVEVASLATQQVHLPVRPRLGFACRNQKAETRHKCTAVAGDATELGVRVRTNIFCHLRVAGKAKCRIARHVALQAASRATTKRRKRHEQYNEGNPKTPFPAIGQLGRLQFLWPDHGPILILVRHSKRGTLPRRGRRISARYNERPIPRRVKSPLRLACKFSLAGLRNYYRDCPAGPRYQPRTVFRFSLRAVAYRSSRDKVPPCSSVAYWRAFVPHCS